MPTSFYPLCLFVFTLYSICVQSASAQTLTLEIDAENGTSTYFRDGVVVTNLRIRKGETILVRVRNFNNYLFSPVISERNEDETPGGGGMPMLGAPSFGFGDAMKSGNSSNSLSSIQNAMVCTSEKPLNSAKVREVVQVPSMFSSTNLEAPQNTDKATRVKQAAWNQLRVLAELERDLNLNHTSLDQLKQRKQLRIFSVEEAQKMRLNPHLPPSRLKASAMAVLAKALNLEPGVIPTLDEVFRQNDDRGFLAQVKLTETDLMKRYTLGITHLQSLDLELEGIDSEDLTIPVFEAAFKAQFNASEQVISDSDALLSVVDSLDNVTTESDLQGLMQIWYAYEAIASNDFSTIYQTTLRHDFTTIHVQFQRKTDAVGMETPETVRLAPILLRCSGGIKVNTSVGIALAAYQHKQYTYFIYENTVKAQEDGRFSPYLTSYLHFYAQGRRSVSVGGSLGLGLQIGSELGLSAAHLFVGPSLLFGNSERFVFNAGLMFGKVKQLDRGLAPGSEFIGTDSDLPMRSIYALGYGVGLSFNLKGG
jgi:hypothetical protein